MLWIAVSHKHTVLLEPLDVIDNLYKHFRPRHAVGHNLVEFVLNDEFENLAVVGFRVNESVTRKRVFNAFVGRKIEVDAFVVSVFHLSFNKCVFDFLVKLAFTHN